MKSAVLIAVTLAFCASVAFAQPGGINVFSDPAGLSCDIFDTGPGLLQVYVVHVLATGVTASQFAAPKPDCWPLASFLSDTVSGVVIGNSQTGVAIGYGQCLASPIHILTINYFVSGSPAGLCCLYPVIPDPHVPSGEIEVVDCNQDLLVADGGSGVINPDANCMCQPPLAAEESTWGRVKSLYTE